MSSATAVPVRVTLHGPDGRLDVCVWDGTTPSTVAVDPQGRQQLGLVGEEPAALRAVSGALLDADRPLVEQGVSDGDVLVVSPTGRGSSPASPGRTRRAGRSRRRVPRAPGQAVGAFVVLAGAAVAAVPVGGTLLALASGLLLVAALAAALGAPADPWGDLCRALSPAAAAVGVGTAVAGAGPAPGRTHLALTAAAVAAAVAAAQARNGVDDRDVADVLDVLLVLSCVLAPVLGFGLLAGVPLRALATLAAPVGVLSIRLLPGLVIDVPDDALLELDRLAVTAWSAHERARAHVWRRLRGDEVTGLIARGRRLYEVGVVSATALATTGAVAALLDSAADSATTARWASLGLAGCVAVTLPLCGRGVRDDLGRRALRAGGAVVTLVLALDALLETGTLGRAVTAGACTLAAIVAVVAAVAMGRGWRSVGWGRVADVLEGLAVVLVLPVGFVASGGFEWVRQLTS